MADFRRKVIERDLAGFIRADSTEIAAIVVKSQKGPAFPILNLGEEEIERRYGKPSALYPSVFDAHDFASKGSIWVVSAIGAGALYGGVDVLGTEVTGFGSRTGRDYGTFAYGASTPKEAPTYTVISSATGLTAVFTGTLPKTPIQGGSYILKVAGVTKASTESGGIISGADATGTLNLTSGAYSITFTGTVGSVATVTTTVNFSAPIDFSAGAKNKAIKITVDGTVYDNINLGQSATTSRASVISAINAALGYTAASVSGNFIKIDGQIADATIGVVTIEDPSDLTTYASALTLAFNPTTLTDLASSPTGAVPAYGQSVKIEYIFLQNTASLVSHSFFALSQYSPDDLSVVITRLGGNDFKLALYSIVTGGYAPIQEYNYSLDKKKDNFGKSLYIFDVFRNNDYVVPFVNSNFTGSYTFTSPTTNVDFSGGNRGADPLSGDYADAWDYFKQKNKYKVKLFIDALGNSPNTLQTLVTTYQSQAVGLSMIPIGNNALQAISFKQGLGLTSDKIVLYTNWARVEDRFNNSSAWISQLGRAATKYAAMEDVYDALSPAGVDEDLHGGQLSGFSQVFEFEYDYDETELQLLDDATINPIIPDSTYGPMIVGDRTCNTVLSDTSYVGTRRLYNLIIETVSEQVLKLQEFKNNDQLHRGRAKDKVDTFLEPILALELLREAYVQCDEKNNTDALREQRRFKLSIFVKVTPNSQTVELEFVRVSQTTVLASIIPR